jgi:hypothetical protein
LQCFFGVSTLLHPFRFHSQEVDKKVLRESRIYESIKYLRFIYTLCIIMVNLL